LHSLSFNRLRFIHPCSPHPPTMSDVFPHPDHKIFEPTEKNKAFIELIQKIARDDPEAMMEYARSAFAGKGGEELVKQVAESRETINRVKAAFTKIGATLESVDAKKLNISGKPIRTFATAWEEVTKVGLS
jgi:methyl-accepting chemotaxis protein